jgi:hypothetical protein
MPVPKYNPNNQRKIYGSDWSSIEQIANDFDTQDKVTEDELIFAYYSYEDGTALVVYQRGGKLYEVNGGHCSCNGLEGQWEPEETTPEALSARKFSSYSLDTEAISGFRQHWPEPTKEA